MKFNKTSKLIYKLCLHIVFLFFAQSCAEKTQEQKIDNCITDFIENDLDNDISKKDDIYIIIPLNLCSTCLIPIKEILNKNNSKKHNVHLVISALSRKKINYFTEDYSNKYHVIYDNEMRIENLKCLQPKNIHYFKYVNNNLEKFSLIDLNSDFSQLVNILSN